MKEKNEELKLWNWTKVEKLKTNEKEELEKGKSIFQKYYYKA